MPRLEVSSQGTTTASRKARRQPAPAPPPVTAEPAQEAPPPVRELHSFRGRLVYWMTFAAAVWALSRAIHFYNVLAGTKDAPITEGAAWAYFIAAATGLVLCVLVLGLYVYEAERSKGTLQRRVALFERLLARTDGEPNA